MLSSSSFRLISAVSSRAASSRRRPSSLVQLLAVSSLVAQALSVNPASLSTATFCASSNTSTKHQQHARYQNSRTMSTTAAAASATSTTPFVVEQFPCLNDNYGYLIHDSVTGDTAAVDTPDAKAYHAILQQKGWSLTHILNTHHHWDHTGGNKELCQLYPDCQVYGPASENIPNRHVGLKEGDTVSFGKSSSAWKVMDVGGHTSGHIAFYNDRMAFVGDALFALGCGRMFEGTPPQFWNSLTKLRSTLSDETLIYCAHEYTMSNAKFALSVEPKNEQLVERVKEIESLRAQNQPTVPSTMGIEKATNPFLRCDVSPEIQGNVGFASAPKDFAEVFAKVRAAKDNF